MYIAMTNQKGGYLLELLILKIINSLLQKTKVNRKIMINNTLCKLMS